MVAFGFLPQNFGRWQDLQIVLLSFCECRFNSRDMLKNLFELIALKGGGDAKTLGTSTHAQAQALVPIASTRDLALAPEPLGETFTT